MEPEMENEQNEGEMPLPTPPEGRKSDIFNIADFTDVDDRASKAPTHLNSSFQALIDYLTKDLDTDLQKVRAFFVWMSNQNFLKRDDEEVNETTPAGYLAKIASKRGGLVELFQRLCEEAGLHCVTLEGYCKWFGPFGPGGPEEPCENSKWNAVYVDGNWRLLHLALSFHYLRLKRSLEITVETSGEAVRKGVEPTVTGDVDERYFLPDPDEFIYMCRPDRDDFQLLGEKAWDWDTFIKALRFKYPLMSQEPSRSSSPEEVDIGSLDVPDCEDSYPPPQSPTCRKEDILQGTDFSNIDERASKADGEVVSDYKKLFEYLFEGLTTDVHKVRAILAWYCNNTRPGHTSVPRKMVCEATDPNTPAGAIKLMSRAGITSDQFFAILCRQAGFPCVLIHGCAKRADVYVLGESSCTKKHAWHAVYLDNDWRLINTYDAVNRLEFEECEEMDAAGKFRLKRIPLWYPRDRPVEFFFLTDPEQLIHFCLPDKPEWQLLQEPVTEEQFFDEPWIQPAYFQSPWQLRKRQTASSFQGRLSESRRTRQLPESRPGNVYEQSVILHARHGVGAMVLENKSQDADQPFRYNLYFKPSTPEEKFPEDLQEKPFITTTKISNKPVTISVLVCLPVTGLYILEVLDDAGQTTFKMLVRCDGDLNNQWQFPENFNGSFGPGKEAEEAGLLDPSHRRGYLVAMPGDTVQIKFKLRVQKTKKKEPRVVNKGGVLKLLPAEKERVITPEMEFSTRLAHPTLPTEVLENFMILKQDKKQLEVGVDIPADTDNPEFCLHINGRKKGEDGAFANLVNYRMTSDHNMAAAASNMDATGLKIEELVEATQDDSVSRLEAAIREVSHASPPIQCDELHLDAEQRLFDCYQQGVNKAELSENIEDLTQLVTSAETSMIKGSLQTMTWFKDAQRYVEIAEAAKGSDVTRLEKAVRMSHEHRKPHSPLEVKVQQQAQRRLVELHRQACEKAIHFGTADDLSAALESANQSEVAYFVHKAHWYSTAGEVLRRKKRQEYSNTPRRRVSSTSSTNSTADRPAQPKTARQ